MSEWRELSQDELLLFNNTINSKSARVGKLIYTGASTVVSLSFTYMALSFVISGDKVGYFLFIMALVVLGYTGFWFYSEMQAILASRRGTVTVCRAEVCNKISHKDDKGRHRYTIIVRVSKRNKVITRRVSLSKLDYSMVYTGGFVYIVKYGENYFNLEFLSTS